MVMIEKEDWMVMMEKEDEVEMGMVEKENR